MMIFAAQPRPRMEMTFDLALFLQDCGTEPFYSPQDRRKQRGNLGSIEEG